MASVGVLSAAGFEREGLLRHDRWDGARWRDSLLFALLDEGSSA
jgi:RimJ/RimL family protein N-acetyltransferase